MIERFVRYTCDRCGKVVETGYGCPVPYGWDYIEVKSVQKLLCPNCNIAYGDAVAGFIGNKSNDTKPVKKPFISLAKEIRKGGTFLSHYYEVGYKKQNTIQTIENFRYFDDAYNFYKEHDCNYFIEIEVWQYEGRQETVVLDWNKSKEKFELAK